MAQVPLIILFFKHDVYVTTILVLHKLIVVLYILIQKSVFISVIKPHVDCIPYNFRLTLEFS